jgi:uncharacterized protein (DUF433 family)
MIVDTHPESLWEKAMSTEVSLGVIVDPLIHHGKPVIKGTRIPAELVVGKLAGGMSESEVMDEYAITVEDIRAALGYAADVLAHTEIRGVK